MVDMQALVKLIALVISIPLTVSSISAMKIADDINGLVNSESTYQQSISTHHAAEQEDPDSMPENPRVGLPDEVSSNIPADATVISKDLTVSKDGTVQDIETGQEVTDPKIVGTEDKPADPLAKTDGQKFIPVDVGTVREAVEQQDGHNTNAASAMNTYDETASARPAVQVEHQAQGNVRLAALQNNSYGAYWGSYGGRPAFFERQGNPYIQDAKGVIDVSEHQGYIDWNRAKASGVEGAIIRISYGWGNGYDKWGLRNIQECKRLGIPFGIYSYSYSYDANTARAEANDIVNLMRQAGVYPGTLGYPVFYDLENWTWKGHHVPTNPDVYASIVDTWMNIVRGAGYDGQVYSYTSYINSSLNRASIRNRVGWVASYGARAGFETATNKRGWQYTSTGYVAGINGHVDLNAFGVKNLSASQVPDHDGKSLDSLGTKDSSIPEGDYYIASVYDNRYLDVYGASKEANTRLDIYPFNNGSNQKFHIKHLGNGNYQIKAVHSGLVLDAAGPSSRNGTPVIQFSSNGGSNQQWMLYKTSDGSYLIASTYAGNKNKVIDIPNGDKNPTTLINLWAANGGDNQKFRLIRTNQLNAQGTGWVSNGNNWYWYSNGTMLRNREFQDPYSGKWYLLNPDGTMARGWKTLADGRRVYYNPSSGAITYGEAQIDGHWYYFDTYYGTMARGMKYVQSSGGKWVYYNWNSGQMMYGEQYVDYDKEHTGWYLFDSQTGAMQYGDVYLTKGSKWVRYDTYTGIMVKGLQRYDGSWYYFDPVTGAMAHGWAYVPQWGRNHYFDMITGRG
ncbi:hypothetical protein GCM10007377_09830 [Galliscardovia ingluviei]|uniref:Ricin B lectin domain-containing protein n=2 Tax=Galliscardovia ingluviei TaxID=1769422 RepID=A0A8J3AGV5_9BIFI|nr:hypothetical protein GCM10007377_09830 [Galliscardovia ingluviei]